MANLSNINNVLRTGSLGVGINRDPLGAFEISSATKPGIKMFNTATNGKTYEAYSDTNGNYIIYDQDADSNRLTISSAGNATFAGSVHIDTKANSGLAYNVLIDIGSNGDGTIGYQTPTQLVDNLTGGYNGLTFADGTEALNTTVGCVIATPSRSSSPTPEDYKRSFSTEFKGKTASGSPGTGSSWIGLVSMSPYRPSTSGFYTTQLGFGADGTNGDMFIRRGTTTSWGDWRKFIISDSSGNTTFTGEVNVPSGKISILGGNNLTISGTAANHAGLSFGTNIIYPATAAGTNNNTFDLGDPDERFKDAYFGGTVYASKLTLPQEEENGFKIEFTGGSYSSGISTVDQSGSGLYIGANSYVNNGGSITYKDSALDSNGIYFDAWNGNNIKFYTALAGTPQQRMSIAGDGAVVINGTTSLVGNVRIGGTTLATSSLHVYDSFGNGGSLWSIGESATYAYTAHKQWTSLSGSPTPTAAYYRIGVIEDSRSAIINIKTAAHSCATILVSRGYGPSNLARFQVLSSTKNANGGYANITGIQISAGGGVDIKLQWSTGPNVAVEITVYGNGFTVADTLAVSGASTSSNYPDNVLWQHDLPGDAGSAMVPGQFRVTGNIVNPGTWGTTTGSAANVHVDSNGTFFRSTSSLKYKKDVRNYDKGLNEVIQLKPKYYKGNEDEDVQFAGLIAEDVHDLGLNEFVQYAEDGTPDALAYPNMIALLTKAIQELKADNDSLRARIETLENK